MERPLHLSDPLPATLQTQQFFLQFITRYQHWDTSIRCRVTTITRRWTDGSAVGDLIAGFDQEAAAVAMARLCSWKMETEEDFDATRWLDRTLIRLASRFGDYRKDDPQSFQLSPQLSYYPQFMFNLRRSQFVQVGADYWDRDGVPLAERFTGPLPGVQQQPRRDCLLQACAVPRKCWRFYGDDTASDHGLLVQRTARASAPGCFVCTAGQDSPARRLLLSRGL